MRRILFHIPLLALTLCGACGGRADSDAGKASEEWQLELPAPAVPDSITEPEERAAWAALHWWDDLDFSDHRRSLDTAFMEQNFSNFISVAAYADSIGRVQGVERLMKRAEADSAAWRFVVDVAEKYLYDPNSPFRSDELYAPFLRAQLASPLADEARRVRDAHRLKMAMKNRVGTRATNFRFVTADGRDMSLSDVRSEKEILLIFYNPDCESCGEVVERFGKLPMTEWFTVLAIDAESDRGRWEATKMDMPEGWTVGYALSPILDEDMYDLKASPTIYVLDSTGVVIAKDIPPESLAPQR